MKRFLCICAAVAAAAGCGGKDDVFEAEHTFHPLENTECVTELSSFIDEMSYVRLADDERLFLAGGISKALLDGNGNIHVLDFGDKAIPERYYFDAAGEDITKYMTADYYKLPMDLHLTSSHAYFHACGPGAEDTGFVLGTDSGKGIRWTNEGGDMALNLFGADEDSFYALMLPCESYGSPDGTYVVRIKFKDF